MNSVTRVLTAATYPLVHFGITAMLKDFTDIHCIGRAYTRREPLINVGADDSFASAVERIFSVVNGPMGVDNPQRQGFNSALAGEGGPLNAPGGIPTAATDYSPL